jgi:hypothetical protein
MELADFLPIQASVRRQLEELIGTRDGAAYATRQPEYKRALSQSLTHWAGSTTRPPPMLPLSTSLFATATCVSRRAKLLGWKYRPSP